MNRDTNYSSVNAGVGYKFSPRRKNFIILSLIATLIIAGSGAYAGYLYITEQDRIARRTAEADQSCAEMQDMSASFLVKRDNFVAENFIPIFGLPLQEKTEIRQ